MTFTPDLDERAAVLALQRADAGSGRVVAAHRLPSCCERTLDSSVQLFLFLSRRDAHHTPAEAS
ncbi:hypothetical protein WMF11_25035 [Sorangium sp. So ce295]|uniref:hypothetical protein n=1 Tax=Sorangium sp. So ce295 TaxID=3133295 RepID=UPI003F60BBC9